MLLNIAAYEIRLMVEIS